MNPYESPREIEQLELDDSDFGPPHPSNRTMSVVIGVPGLLFFGIGVLALTGTLLAASVSPQKPFNITASMVIIDVILPTIGLTLLWVSAFLWRYDATHR